MKIIVVNETSFSVNARRLQKICDEVCKALAQKKLRNLQLLNAPELTCVFLDPKAMKKINKQFRGKDKPTDVLSFESGDPLSMGELLFCPRVLKKQAREQKHSLNFELLYMLIHGFLHLMGYDHEKSPRQEKLMFSIQDGMFEQLTAKKINLDCLHVNRSGTQ